EPAPGSPPGRKGLAQRFGWWRREGTACVRRAEGRGRKRAGRLWGRTAPDPFRVLEGPGPDVAGAEGFEPSTAGLGTRCPIQTRLRAPECHCVRDIRPLRPPPALGRP